MVAVTLVCVDVTVVKALVVVVAIALIASQTVVVSVSLMGATKTTLADKTIILNLEAISMVATKTLVIVVVVASVVESMTLLVIVAKLMVISLDPGMTSSSTAGGRWGHASLLEQMRRVVFVLVVVRAHTEGLGLGLGLGLDLDRRMNRSLSLRTRKWQRGVALFTVGAVMDRSQGMGHGFISRDWGSALITTETRGSLQETGGFGADPWFKCLWVGSCCWCGRDDGGGGGGLRTLLWLGQLL